MVEALSAEHAHLRALEARLPELESAEADAQRRAVTRADEMTDLERRTEAVAALRREHSARVAALDERRSMLTRRLAEVEDRLARDPEAKAAAERYRADLIAKGDAYGSVGERLDELTIRIDAASTWLRGGTPHPDGARECGRRLAGGAPNPSVAPRSTHSPACASGCSDARSKRPRTACGSRRPSSASGPSSTANLASRSTSPAPEVPEGTTLAGRARDLDRDLRIMGPINPLALEEYEALQERHDFLVAATRRREEQSA